MFSPLSLYESSGEKLKNIAQENPIASKILAVPAGVFVGGIVLVGGTVALVCHAAMTALSLIAVVFTLGLSDKARENLAYHAFYFIRTAILLPPYVPLSILGVAGTLFFGIDLIGF